MLHLIDESMNQFSDLPKAARLSECFALKNGMVKNYSNRVCKIIGTDILMLYEAILHLVSLKSIQILSLEVVFAYPFLRQPFYCIFLIKEGINQKNLYQIIASFYQKNVAEGKSYTVKDFCQEGIPKAQVYNVIEYEEATESVNNSKGVGTFQNLTKP